jgi:hypothetical protein
VKKIIISVGLFFLFSAMTIAQIKIKADRFYPFSEGYAVVSYGTAYAVIDKSGNFVIPYNKFHLENFGLSSLEPKHGFINGGCVAIDPASRQQGMIDIKGNWIVPAEYMLITPFDKEGWCRVTDFKQNDFFLNKAGTKIPVSPSFFAYRSSRISSNGGLADLFNGGPSRERALSGKEYVGRFNASISPGGVSGGGSSFFNRAGKQIVSQKFNSLKPLQEGLACASIINEFGETKFGFIDEKGNTIIPFSFSRQPGNFYNGLAYGEPLTRNEFDFGFINKKGEVVLKFKNASPVFQTSDMPHFEDGYFRMFVKDLSSNYFKMIDTTGKDVQSVAFMKEKMRFSNVNNKTFGTFQNHIQIFNANPGVAFVNVDNGKVVYTDFYEINPFDMVSGLTLATGGKNGGWVYINQSGNVFIAMAPKSEF